MHLAQFKPYSKWLNNGILIIVLLAAVACSSNSQPAPTARNDSSPTATPSSSKLLPGEHLWKGGVPSFLFGTNDSQEWGTNNIQTVPSIQQALKDAHFTLMRTFFFARSLVDNHPTTDAEIETRIRTVEKTGMTCLGVLPHIYDVAFDQHLVTLLGKRCNIYEFGNEPGYNGISVQNYIAQWNLVIPQLKKLNPDAKFIGGAGAELDYTQQFLLGVQASGVIPDAIDIHWYACSGDGPSTCLPKATNVIDTVLEFRTMIQATLGYELPVGVGEWNMDPGNNSTLANNDAFMTAFTKAALKAMIQLKVAFANEFGAANYAGYGTLDMFHLDKPGFPPKAQYYAMKSIISEYIL